MRIHDFLKSGHPPTLFTSLLYFDFCFAIWVLNAALAPQISSQLGLSDAQKGWLLGVPVLAGALLRFPMGILAQYIGRKQTAQLQMGIIVAGLLAGYFFADSFGEVLALGVVLGVAGASFGVALSLGAGWFPPRYKGLAMGIAGAGNSGAVLAVLFAPPLAVRYGWQSVYGLAIPPIVVAMLLLHKFAKEPPDRDPKKPLSDSLRIVFDRDAWIMNLLYMVTFGGFIGLTSFLPTLFHDQYGIAQSDIGRYSAGIILTASALRVAGGWIADRIGGVSMLLGLCSLLIPATLAAALLPENPWSMVAILMLCFAAMGAGNGAVFQLVPLRFGVNTAAASSLIGEVGALAGGFVPVAMGYGKQYAGSFTPGFLLGTVLTSVGLAALLRVQREWTTTWVGRGGRALESIRERTPPQPRAQQETAPATPNLPIISTATGLSS